MMLARIVFSTPQAVQVGLRCKQHIFQPSFFSKLSQGQILHKALTSEEIVYGEQVPR